jgi:hypothetical protein
MHEVTIYIPKNYSSKYNYHTKTKLLNYISNFLGSANGNGLIILRFILVRVLTTLN